MMNPAAPADNANEAAWTATVTHQESYGDEEEITTHQTGTKPCLVWVFRIINMILCVMMAATGAIGIKNMCSCRVEIRSTFVNKTPVTPSSRRAGPGGA